MALATYATDTKLHHKHTYIFKKNSIMCDKTKCESIGLHYILAHEPPPTVEQKCHECSPQNATSTPEWLKHVHVRLTFFFLLILSLYFLGFYKIRVSLI